MRFPRFKLMYDAASCCINALNTVYGYSMCVRVH